MNCYYCDAQNDLRPYGPRGAMVCFRCAMKTPDRKKETENNFASQLNAIHGTVVLDDTNIGPYPAKNNPLLKNIDKELQKLV